MLSEYNLLDSKQFNKKNYFRLLNCFKKLGFNFVSYKNIRPKKKIILRHDVDFSTDLARKIALWDKKLGIQSHFFFQYDSEFYNLITPKNIENLKFIKKLNHILGFHISIKDNKKIKEELSLLVKLFKIHKLEFNKIFSIHRIGSKKNKINFPNYKNFYDIKSSNIYFSDSGGSFRFGSPLKNKKIILDKSSFQLNLHPIWWTLENFYTKKNKIKSIQKTIISTLNDELSGYKLL